MPTFSTSDGIEIFYKDWGTGQPIVFSHGWPLSADDWDAQMFHGSRSPSQRDAASRGTVRRPDPSGSRLIGLGRQRSRDSQQKELQYGWVASRLRTPACDDVACGSKCEEWASSRYVRLTADFGSADGASGVYEFMT
jgi:pimeloyl-ACP methyl ester carboxylesterase